MKKLTTFLAFMALAFWSNATVLTVSNDPSASAQYTKIGDAIAAASAGDTIYINGSSISYNESLSFDKKLTLIGPGKYPDSPKHLHARIRSLLVQSNGTGTAIYGIRFNDWINIAAANCLVSGCFGGSISVNAANIILRDNVFSNPGNVNPYAVSSNGNATNLILENNIIYSQFYKISGATIRNNVFARGIDLFKQSNTNLLENNVFYGSYLRNCSSCTFNNNITYGGSNDSLPATYSGSNNIIGKNPEFVNAPLSFEPQEFWKYDFSLTSSSPAKSKGKDGKDMGIYGGGNPATKSGNANIPQVTSFDVENTIVPAGGKVKVRIISTKPE